MEEKEHYEKQIKEIEEQYGDMIHSKGVDVTMDDYNDTCTNASGLHNPTNNGDQDTVYNASKKGGQNREQDSASETLQNDDSSRLAASRRKGNSKDLHK